MSLESHTALSQETWEVQSFKLLISGFGVSVRDMTPEGGPGGAKISGGLGARSAHNPFIKPRF